MSKQYDGLGRHQARLNITWSGQNGDLLDPVPYNATDSQLKALAEEAISGGSVPGIRRDHRADLTDFVVDRFPARGQVGHNRVFLRPKTPFGAC